MDLEKRVEQQGLDRKKARKSKIITVEKIKLSITSQRKLENRIRVIRNQGWAGSRIGHLVT